MPVPPEDLELALRRLQSSSTNQWEILDSGHINPYMLKSVMQAQSIVLLAIYERLNPGDSRTS